MARLLLGFKLVDFRFHSKLTSGPPLELKYYNLCSGRQTSPACRCALFPSPLDHLDKGPGLLDLLNFRLALSHFKSNHTPGAWYEVVYAPSPSNPIQNGADLQTC